MEFMPKLHELLPHSQYALNIALNDFHLFANLKAPDGVCKFRGQVGRWLRGECLLNGDGRGEMKYLTRNNAITSVLYYQCSRKS